jgi:DNA (cytosine-5)-methyltransferase 1
VDHPFKSPTILSFCTGMRGLERGLERVIGPVTVTTYVEIEAFIIFNLVRQMEKGLVDPAPVWTNAKTFPAKRFHGKIHGILGGYPCQPFSVIGKQTGAQHEAHLWPYLKHAARIIRPLWLGFENVVNHLNIGYEEVKADMEELGYIVKEGIYSAAEAGASHRRERLFIFAILADSESICRRLLLQQRGSQQDSTESERSCKNVVHASSQGLEGYAGNVNISTRPRGGGAYTGQARSITKASFPLGQGYEQHEWEEPRTIKPGVGCTINGYNFHADLLRMYGNGVVEQTAEIAFRDLLKKHFGE